MQREKPVRKTIGVAGVAALVGLCVVALCAGGTAALWLGENEMDVTTQKELEMAAAACHAGRFAEAEAAYLAIDRRSPDNPVVSQQLGNIALWNNRTGEAEQYYQDALASSPWYTNFWPLTSDLKYRLGLAYYRADRFSEAADVMHEAVGPVAAGPFADLQALARQMDLFANQTPYEIEGPETSLVEFLLTDPLPVVQVSVNGLPARRFFIDTGGAELILDDDLAKEAGAQIGGSISSPYAGGKTATTGLGRVAEVRIGEFTVRNVPIHTLDTDHWSSGFGMEIKGVIGTRFLMHFLATIDYPEQSLILRRISPSNQQRFEEQLSPGAAAIPFWLADLHTIVAWGTVNDLEPMLFFVDTGLAGKAFTAPEEVLLRAGIPVDWNTAGEGIGGGTESFRTVEIPIRRLSLGSGGNEIVETDLKGSAIEGGAHTLGDSLGFQISGLISHQFFRGHALTFDFQAMRLYLD